MIDLARLFVQLFVLDLLRLHLEIVLIVVGLVDRRSNRYLFLRVVRPCCNVLPEQVVCVIVSLVELASAADAHVIADLRHVRHLHGGSDRG